MRPDLLTDAAKYYARYCHNLAISWATELSFRGGLQWFWRLSITKNKFLLHGNVNWTDILLRRNQATARSRPISPFLHLTAETKWRPLTITQTKNLCLFVCLSACLSQTFNARQLWKACHRIVPTFPNPFIKSVYGLSYYTKAIG